MDTPELIAAADNEGADPKGGKVDVSEKAKPASASACAC